MSGVVRALSLLVMVGILTACTATPRPLLIVAALPQEIAPLLPHLTDQREIALQTGVALTGRLDGQDVVLMTTGVGLVNAAATTQRGLERFNPSAVLMVGVAGAIDPALPLGAVVIPEYWVNHQVGAARPDGFYPVITPYQAAPDWLNRAQMLSDVITGGVGVSGDIFVNDPATRDRLSATFSARIVDMESAAVAQVATQNAVPFLIIRAVSDTAGGQAEQEVAYSVDAAILAACDALRDILNPSFG